MLAHYVLKSCIKSANDLLKMPSVQAKSIDALDPGRHLGHRRHHEVCDLQVFQEDFRAAH